MKANLAEAHDQLLKTARLAQRAIKALNDSANASGSALQMDCLMIAAAASDAARSNATNAEYTIRKELGTCINEQPNVKATS